MEYTEIFAHDTFVTEDFEAPGVYIIGGKDWEGRPFHLYLREDEAKSVLVQLGYQVYEKERTNED